MQRRHFTLHASATGFALLIPATLAHAQGLLAFSDADASKGLKAALETGAQAAVSLLGKADGFLGNPKVRIPLPGYLNDAAKFMRTLGQGKRVDELVTGMNRAAEGAVPMAKTLLSDAVKGMSVTDAKKILTGGDTSVTDFFANKTRTPLGTQFLPMVKTVTEKIDLAQKYDALAKKGTGLGLVKKEDASIDHYVTRKSLDGLYLIIGDEEKKIRQNPMAAGSDILKKVFGGLR